MLQSSIVKSLLVAVVLILSLTVVMAAAPVKPPVNQTEPAGQLSGKAAIPTATMKLQAGAAGVADDGPGIPANIPAMPTKQFRPATAAATAIYHGEFGGAPYAKVDAGAVAAFKAEAALIGAGGYTSDTEYRGLDACLISFDNGSTYATDRGGCIYIQTVVTGLQAGDIVYVDNNYFYDDGTGYYSYWDQAPYWVLINPYTHNSTATINNWLIYFEADGLGGYTMVIGSGEYNLALNNDDLTTVIGDKFRLTRQVRVYQGATLVSPATSSRGYTYSTAGITGGTETDASYLDTPDLDLVGASPVWVDDDWAGSDNGDIVGGHIYGEDAFDNIQQGVDGSVAGGVVNVLAGGYVENIVVGNSVHVSGAGQAVVTVYPALSAPNPVGGGSMPPGASHMMLIAANDVELSGMTLDGDNPALTSGIVVGGADLDARNGIITDHPSGVYNGLLIHDCTVKNIYLRGIYASSGGTFNFHHNTVDNVNAEYASIGMFNYGGAGTFAYNTVSNCNDAISSNHSRGCQFLNNIVTGCGSGVHTDNAGDGGGVADLIDGNQISNSALYGYGIFTFVPYILPVVQNNTITNVDVGLTAAGSYAAVTPQFLNNTVDGQNKTNSTGVYITTEIWGYTSGNVTVLMQNNSITNNTDAFYVVAEAGFTNALTVFDNEIRNNSNSSVYAATGTMGAGTFNLNFSGNWWGVTDPTAVATPIYAVADYTPWLGGGTATTPGFAGDFSLLWVDDDSPQTGSVNRVQEAVNLVSGSTINLAPGTYPGQVVISGFTDLDLIGAGIGVSTIQATASMAHSFNSGSNNNFAVVSVESSTGVDISDLTIDGLGLGNSNYRFVGAAYFNAGGSMTDVEVKDCRNTPLDGGQHGIGIYALILDAVDRTLDLTDCIVSGFQKGGIVFIGADLTATANGCTVTGGGPMQLGWPAQNGIQFSTVAGGSAIGNTINYISYVPATWAATGFLIYGPETLTIDGNNLNECQFGAYMIDAAGSFSGNAFTATPAGTGMQEYYGLYVLSQVAAKGKQRQAQPYDAELIAGIKSDLERQALAPNALVVTADDNIMDGGNGTSSQGIVAYSYTAGNLQFSADNNRLTNFEWGAGVYANPSPVTAVFTNSEFLYNNVGFESYGGTVDVQFNIFQNTTNATDDLAGNTYNQNCWHDWSGVGPYAIGGGGGNTDANPVADCGLDMTPNSIVYDCSGDFTFDVGIGSAVTALDAANIWLEYPAELTVTNVTGASGNYFVAYTQSTNILNTRDTLKVNLGVLTGVEDGPAPLFTVAMNGSVSCLAGDIMMIYRDLRDSTNSQIIVPPATAIDFQSNCADPDVVVNSPAAGGFYNIAPVLSLTATDDCDLNALYYQVDGCTPGGWLPIATGLSGTIYNNPTWSLSGAEFAALTEASHCIRFKVTDDFGRANADSCSYTWCFTKDVTAPTPPINLVAQPGHNKVQLSWINSSSPDAIGVQIQRIPWTDYPNYGSMPTPTAAPAYPANQLTGTTILSAGATPSTPGNHTDVMGLSNATRDIYYFGAFAYDAAGNYSVAAPSAQARSTSYWLGDLANEAVTLGAFDGLVYFGDLVHFSSTYGLNEGDGGYISHADFGPTHNNSPKGIPMPDDKVEFEDLAIFAINFDDVVPMAAKSSPHLTGVAPLPYTGMTLESRATTDGYLVDLVLANGNNDAKSLLAEITYDRVNLTLVSVQPASDIVAGGQPVFFKTLDSENGISVSVAALGNGVSFRGSGVIATLQFQQRTAQPAKVVLGRQEIRDNENRSLLPAVLPTEEPVTIAAEAAAGTCVVYQNSPNPFNPDTKIAYSLPKASAVSVRIYNVMGQAVRTLVDGAQTAGYHEVIWNGRDESGNLAASGVYFYRFETDGFAKTVKMTLMK
ncbi:MAG: T9SS type A sorting domain-containing protein [candidate division Zixibacteria bacterium]|nr:T9SS type A sorting domain-containing protein [candidate division Zixibacteria bacterium]